MKQFEKSGAAVLGISGDSPEAQKKFETKQKLKMPLLSDAGNAVGKAWGFYGQKKLYGRSFMGIIRSTFLIDPSGNLAKAWRGVRVAGHAEAVLAALKDLTD